MTEEVVHSSDFTDEQEALLALMLDQEGIDTPTIQTITRRVERLSLPLSFSQQRLWFLDQLAPNNAFYNMLYAFKLQGVLDVGVFERILNEVVRRHEVLRTNFVSVDGQPIQTIAETRRVTLPIVDLQHFPLAERTAETQRLTLEEAKKPFNLAEDALIRTTLLRLGEEEYMFLLTLHHIISDGWSEGVLIKEISTLYEAFLQGKPSPLPELPIQYADFTQWQREWLQGDVRSRLLTYWKRRLDGLSPLELLTDRPRPAYLTFNGALFSLRLPHALVDNLKALSKQEDVTLFMTLLAAFKTLLVRYSGQNDIAVGSPIANRTYTELEGLIGFFVNTLVLRTNLSGNPSFRILLRRIREMLLEAYSYQDLPFEHLVEEMHVPRDPSRSPLFQVMFNLQNTPHTAFHLPKLTLNSLLIDGKASRFDLTLFLEEDNNDLNIIAEYSTDLFDEETIRRLLGHYQTILESVVANPELSLATIPLLAPEERKQLISDWNNTETPFPSDRCIHHLIEEQVQRTPSAIAVISAGHALTYQDFNSRANQLAHHLHHLGVQPGMRVGLYLERSLDALVALLGILKAGCAYVPIDPANPGERVAFMLQNAQISILLTHQHLISTLPQHQAHLVCLDSDWPTIATAPATNPVCTVQPANLFYVMYTSGSTGKPKGVAMSHRALCNLLTWQLNTMVPPRAARLLQYASLSFDVSYQEIFPTLSAGGTIFMITEELRRDPVALLRFIDEQQVQKLYLPVVALQQLADAYGMGNVQLASLREITAAGEQLQITPQMIHFFRKLKECTLHNFYGPTETHGTTIFTLSGEPEQWPTLVPIGRPIANDQNYVLDAYGQLLPIGVSGELHLGGVGVADGYFNRPDLTAERFVPDPFGKQPGARLYKTGDLARWRADGILEFLGRIDHQVKVRGFRVELEEIEAVLNQHPAVQESVVVVREDVPGDKRLIAYLVTEVDLRPTMSELRGMVQAQLPEYMVPAMYVFLEALPLTINRKVDRRRLPKPDYERPELEASFVAPDTSTEQELAKIWLEISELNAWVCMITSSSWVDTSLLVTQIVSRVRTLFGVEVNVRDLFTAPTIAQLATQIDESLLKRLDSTDIDDVLMLLDGMDDDEAERMLEQLDAATLRDQV